LIEQRTVERLRPLVADRVPDATVALVTVAHSPRLAGFSVVRDDELEQLYVAEELRGSGVADELMGRAERRVAERFERAWLAVVAGNLRAMSFYQRCGWRDAGPYDNPAETGAGVIMVPCRRCDRFPGCRKPRSATPAVMYRMRTMTS
jgi:GNAT superfamily N-acetyltransferase